MTTHRFLTENQINLFTAMVEERFAADDDAGRAPYRKAWFTIASREDFDRVLTSLKATPTLAKRRSEDDRNAEQDAREARKALVPTEEGLYRNPETGELYRLRQQGWDMIVSKYSKTATRRRLTTDGKIEKGTWKRYNAFQSRQALSAYRAEPQVQKSWLMSDQDKIEYQYGMCGFCYRGLEDAVSVAMNYGPVCAKKFHLPWSEEAARAKGFEVRS
jgi:hypothetical protein